MNKKSPAFYGVLASLALIASYVESLVPLPVPVPGIRLGLANAVVLAVLELFGFREAFLVSVVRILLSGFLFGNLSSIFYSLGGGLLSLLLMNLLYKKGSFGTLGISMAGGVAHNFGQLLVASLAVQTVKSIYGNNAIAKFRGHNDKVRIFPEKLLHKSIQSPLTLIFQSPADIAVKMVHGLSG